MIFGKFTAEVEDDRLAMGRGVGYSAMYLNREEALVAYDAICEFLDLNPGKPQDDGKGNKGIVYIIDQTKASA